MRLDNFISGFDFDPNGEKMATITQYGECLISDVHTNDCNFYLSLEMSNAEGNINDNRSVFAQLFRLFWPLQMEHVY